jgi:DNA modification methylase
MKEISEFKSPLSYSDRKMWIPETIKHPAKAHLGMIEAIILEYTKEGDTILDPMAGIGSTLILAMIHNRNAIGIEYEEKFYKTIKANIDLNRFPRSLGNGHAEIIHGDARFLSTMFRGRADSVVMSPPYSESLTKKRKGDTHIDELKHTRQMVGTKDDNIANLPHGDIDAIVTSPPYAEQKRHDARAHNPKAIDKMATKFEEKGEGSFHTNGRLQTIGVHYSGYSEDDNNIGNLPFKEIDSIITSPPYEQGFRANPKVDLEKRFKKMKQVERESVKKGQKWAMSSDEVLRKRVAQQDLGYGTGPDNIGNFKGQTYLEAMKMVYQGCYGVLKENGIMVLITKNFIRNKKIVPLDEHTINLCKSVGFTYVKRHYRKITRQSFWRRLYKQKYGLEIPYEDILIFIKLENGC